MHYRRSHWLDELSLDRLWRNHGLVVGTYGWLLSPVHVRQHASHRSGCHRRVFALHGLHTDCKHRVGDIAFGGARVCAEVARRAKWRTAAVAAATATEWRTGNTRVIIAQRQINR